jgi:hypothetical protein
VSKRFDTHRWERELSTQLLGETSLSDAELFVLEGRAAGAARLGTLTVEHTPRFDTQRDADTVRIYAVRDRLGTVNDFAVWSRMTAPGDGRLDPGRRRVKVEWSDATQDRLTKKLTDVVESGHAFIGFARMAMGMKGFAEYEAFLFTYKTGIETADPSAHVEIRNDADALTPAQGR